MRLNPAARLLAFAFLSACAVNHNSPSSIPETSLDPIYQPLFRQTECPFETPSEVDITCGHLIVPERREPEPAGEVELAVAILKSFADEPQPDPVIFLDGGPGGYTLDLISGQRDFYSAILASRDLIYFDQRGLGYSRPSLDCSEVAAAVNASLDQNLPFEEQTAQDTEALTSCRERLLASGVDITAYTSWDSAADVNDLRRALELEQVNLLGVSYGTLLAQTILDRYAGEEWIRSVILDSVLSAQADIYGEWAANFERSLQVLSANCTADERCSNRFQDLEASIYSLTQELNAEPVRVKIDHPFNGERVDIVVNGDRFLIVVFQMLYSRDQIPRIPDLVYNLEIGRPLVLTDWLQYQVILPEYISEGMMTSVTCGEQTFATSSQVVEAAAVGMDPTIARLNQAEFLQYEQLCQEWGMSRANSVGNQDLNVDIPTLILAGEYDPITPPAWGRQLIGSFSQATFFEFPGTSHYVLDSGGKASDCSQTVANAFLSNPDQPPNADCLNDVKPLALQVP